VVLTNRTGRRLAGVDDHRVVVGRGERTLVVLEPPGEEVVPGRKAPMLIAGKPGLQDVMIVGQPAGAAPHLDTIGKRGHKG
jgi:hypothetical protein